MLARSGLLVVLAGATCAWGQTAISAHSGMIHYVEGKVTLEGQPVDPKFGEFPEVKNNQVLETGEGRAEVLLTPGVFLRVSENSSFKMLSNSLSDTALEVVSGSVLVEVDELLKDNAITLRYKDATIALSKHGLYRVDSDPARFRVYDGEAEVSYGLKNVQAHKGKDVRLDETLLASSFDTKDTDSFYRWASRRSESIAAANVSSARAAGRSGLGSNCNGFAASTNCAGYNGAPFGSPYGAWAWNPYFGMFTYIPALGYGYNPFGWAFYSPLTVGNVYIPGYYGGGYGGPGYLNTNTGPTGLSGARQTSASLGSSPLRTVGSPANSSSSSSGSTSTGGTSSPVSSGSVGGGSVGAASVGAARSSAGGGGGGRR